MVHEDMVAVDDADLWTATQGSGLPLVLCPGGPGDRDYLQPVAEMVDDRALVHRFDPRACGRSTGGSPFTVKRWVDDLEQLRIHWGHRAWVLVGHSFGALLALEYARAHPARTLAVAYISCMWSRSADKARARADFLDRRREQTPHDWVGDPGVAGLAGEIGDLHTAISLYPTIAEAVGETNREVNDELGADYNRLSSSAKHDHAFASLTMPVLVVHGERDPRPTWTMKQLVATLQRAQLVSLPGVGHFPYLEAPEHFAQVLRSWLSNIPPSS